jgi:hypothetical protein
VKARSSSSDGEPVLHAALTSPWDARSVSVTDASGKR